MRKYAMREPDEDDSEFDESDSSAADDDSDEEEPRASSSTPRLSPTMCMLTCTPPSQTRSRTRRRRAPAAHRHRLEEPLAGTRCVSARARPPDASELQLTTLTQGLLRGILDLPLDVLTGVCEHLDLETLFHVSRLNKRFYKFLRGTAALSYLWDWAREESGLPELTAPGFSTVQLANLLFSKYCQVRSLSKLRRARIAFADVHEPLPLCPDLQNCARTTPKVDFLLRVRLCQACSNYLCVSSLAHRSREHSS